MTAKELIIQDIQSCNKHLTTIHLQGMSYVNLLKNSHPAYRSNYARILHNEGSISESEMRMFVKVV